MMKEKTLQTAELLDILPEEDFLLVEALVKRLVSAWDPDYIKVTEKEREVIEKSSFELKNGDFVSEKDIWS